jgi:hypothetical protein
MARRIAVLALLICGVMPQCIAAKLRHHYAAGVYLTHDQQLLQALAKRTLGTYWIDGYRMTISKQTQICWHDAPLQFGAVLNWAAQPVPKLKMTSPCVSAPRLPIEDSAWIQYLGSQAYNFDIFRPLMEVVTARIDVWNSQRNGNRGFAPARQQVLPGTSSAHRLPRSNCAVRTRIRSMWFATQR